MKWIHLQIFCWLVAGSLSAAMPADTVIQSDSLVMHGGEAQNIFLFENDVRVMNKDLLLKCDQLRVIANRHGDPQATIGKVGSIEHIVAEGNVYLEQGERRAYAGRAEVNPQTGEVVLSDSPRIVDTDAEVRGWKIVLNKGERRARVLPDPNADKNKRQRSTVILGGEALPDLSFQNAVDDTAEGTSPEFDKENASVEEEQEQ